MSVMSGAVVFTAKDARQRRHLLKAIGQALDYEAETEKVAARAYEGEDTSVYLFSFWIAGARWAYRHGHDAGYRRGCEKERAVLRSQTPQGAIARAQVRQSRKRKAKKR